MNKSKKLLCVENNMTFSTAWLLNEEEKYILDWYTGNEDEMKESIKALEKFAATEPKDSYTVGFCLFCEIIDRLHPRKAF